MSARKAANKAINCVRFDMEVHQPIDLEGRDLQVGDWVRVITVPLSIQGMPADSLEAFSRAVGHTFQIEEFDQSGCLHLDMYPKVSCDSIYIEPYCVRRFRRYKKLSKAFQKRLAILNSLEEPRLEVEFEARLEPGVDLESFGFEVISRGTGGDFAVWPEERKVKGCITVEVNDPNARTILEAARQKAYEMRGVESFEVSEVRVRNEI